MLYLPLQEVRDCLLRVLLSRGCPQNHAETVAVEMARNSLEGVYTHGVNRFSRLIRNIDEGIVCMDVEPVPVHTFGAIASMDGQMGLGVVNAKIAMAHALSLAKTHGMGMVALRNTNHWMRAATYGYQACETGMAAICFTNTIPNMPAWGALDARLGNNPLVLAIPSPSGDVVLDMAASQFSYGALEKARMEGRQMSVDAGYDANGDLTRDPDAVLQTQRILPMGYWKGAGLSILLDLFAGCFSLGNTTLGISRLTGEEHGLSQVFIALDYRKIAPEAESDAILRETLAYVQGSTVAPRASEVRWPGSRLAETRERNLQNGIPVDERVWASILALEK